MIWVTSSVSGAVKAVLAVVVNNGKSGLLVCCCAMMNSWLCWNLVLNCKKGGRMMGKTQAAALAQLTSDLDITLPYKGQLLHWQNGLMNPGGLPGPFLSVILLVCEMENRIPNLIPMSDGLYFFMGEGSVCFLTYRIIEYSDIKLRVSLETKRR